MQTKIFTEADFSHSADAVVSQLFAFYSLLNASILVLCSVCIHYKPLTYLAILALSFKFLFYFLQGFVSKTIAFSAGLQVPLLITFFGLLGLCSLPWILNDGQRYDNMRTENEDLLGQMKFPKNRKPKYL